MRYDCGMKEPRINVTVRLTPDEIAFIDLVAEEESLPRSIVIRRMLKMARIHATCPPKTVGRLPISDGLGEIQ
jgi:hypothetical protein